MTEETKDIRELTYIVVLTQKAKIEVKAETPEAALEEALEQVAGQKFEPTSFNVKEGK